MLLSKVNSRYNCIKNNKFLFFYPILSLFYVQKEDSQERSGGLLHPVVKVTWHEL